MNRNKYRKTAAVILVIAFSAAMVPSRPGFAKAEPVKKETSKTMPNGQKAFLPTKEAVKPDTYKEVPDWMKQLGITPEQVEAYYKAHEGQAWPGGSAFFDETAGTYKLPDDFWKTIGKEPKPVTPGTDPNDPRQPVTRELTPEEQAQLEEIYGVAPITSKTIALCGGTTVYYYDEDGNLVGTMHQTTGTQQRQPAFYYDKDGKLIQVGDQKFEPPVRPGDDVTDPAVWQKYYRDYVNYIKGITDEATRQAAWGALAKDIFKLSQEHPERITAGAINPVMLALTNELKEKYRNPDYTLNVSVAQQYVVDAALNLVKSDAFKNISDTEQVAVGHYFLLLSVESSWRSEFNAQNSDLYPKIAEFFKIMLENGSVNVKAQAFRQLMHLWRVDHWGSKEGNHEVADQILKQALSFDGGVQALINAWMPNVDNSSLTDEIRSHICDALAQLVWQHDALSAATGQPIPDRLLWVIMRKVTAFLEGVNGGSITISTDFRNSLIHTAGCALITFIKEGKDDTDNQAAYIQFAKNSLLLTADKGGSVTLQSSAINLLNSVMTTARSHNLLNVATKCKEVLMDEDFDAAGYIAKARTDMNTTINADHAAFVGRALANIERLNLEENTGAVDAAKVKETVADIKAWLEDSNHLKDMRNMHWQQKLYEALAVLIEEVCKKGSVGADEALQDDIVAIFATVPGLKDSLVKELATKEAEGLAATLRANGFNELASRIEAVFCPDSQSLLAKMWTFYNDKDYQSASVFAAEAIKRYKDEALKQQASLKDFAPKGKEAQYWALNDVGTAHFILGEIARAQGNKEEARKQYKTVINAFGFAQCWDPQGWFWKVAEAAKEALKKL